ncbi:MAG TPA: ACT domain-containing protein [Candidatus Heimdallarchaeota archaeon]|nr:ACT domain-containing protein [Candidatus Heimdallarchaeota archaeon]
MIDARLQKELVIRTENRVGLIAEISRLLGEMGINFSAISVEAANSGAVLYLISNSQLYARDALRDAGFQVAEREVVMLELPNRPGELCRVTAALARKDIDIEELYATATTGSAKALVVLTCSNNGKAVLMLRGR